MNADDDLDRIRAALIGAWTLQRWSIGFADGRADALPFGADAVGLIVYSADGWMSATIARARRPPLSAPSPRQAPAAEQCAAFESCFHYAGPFALRTVDGAPHVVHSVRLALNPNMVGSDQVRRVAFDSRDDLVLSADEDTRGGLRRHRLHWRRANPET